MLHNQTHQNVPLLLRRAREGLYYLSVTAPSDALDTVLAYLANTPRVYLGVGAVHPARRFAISSSLILTLIWRVTASMVITSPFSINAMVGHLQPLQGNGQIHKTVATTRKRPSVIGTRLLCSKPLPITAEVGDKYFAHTRSALYLRNESQSHL